MILLSFLLLIYTQTILFLQQSQFCYQKKAQFNKFDIKRKFNKIIESKRNLKAQMGQQCSNDHTPQSYELGKKAGGIKITGNNPKVYTPQKKSVYHFQKSTVSSRLNANVERINLSLGNFHHSASYIPPKGTIEQQSYVLNQEGLLYRENSEWKNGMPNGRGELIYPDQSYYVGYMVNGIPSGQGRFISSDGWYYEGDLINQQAQGNGKFVYNKNGFEYSGQWAGDLPDGKGKQTWKKSNGVIVYQGSFINGVKHGDGKYSTPQFTYDGRFENNLINGKGRMVYKNGQVYEGNFLNGRKNGHGIYKWPDHSSFEGQYVQDKKHGFGKYVNPNGKIFQGEWRSGKMQGQGVITHNNKKHYYDWKKNQASPQKKKT